MGGMIFKLLGGKSGSLLVSDYCLPGAFANRAGAVPANGTNYAEQREKGAINMVGKLFGCHTCGDKNAGAYIGDHMPPNKYAKQENSKWYRMIFNGKLDVRQYFYPQCLPCSQVQSKAVNLKWRPLKLNFKSFRAYHLSGVLIGMWWYGSWIPLTMIDFYF